MNHRHLASRPRPGRFLAALASLAAAAASSAQISPERTYYGVGRPVPVRISIPEGAHGPARVLLLAPGTASVIASADVAEGVLDLAQAFPVLWQSKTLAYAQLVVGQRKVGPALVLQPLLTARYASLERTLDPATGRPSPQPSVVFSNLPAELIVHSGIRAYVDRDVVLSTSAGEIRLRLRPDVAPNTAWSFRSLVEGGFYTDVPVHRIVPRFVIQAGDPTGQGSGGPGFLLDLEPSTLAHDFGVVSMARGMDPNSAGSQFFICIDREKVRHLDGLYTSFAQAVSGAEVIESLANTPLQPGTERPAEPLWVHAARLEDAPPYGEGPPPVTRPAPEPAPR
jgi:peptidyl-prolyl cis-trans isomerase B (cyclophilin B)